MILSPINTRFMCNESTGLKSILPNMDLSVLLTNIKTMSKKTLKETKDEIDRYVEETTTNRIPILRRSSSDKTIYLKYSYYTGPLVNSLLNDYRMLTDKIRNNVINRDRISSIHGLIDESCTWRTDIPRIVDSASTFVSDRFFHDELDIFVMNAYDDAVVELFKTLFDNKILYTNNDSVWTFEDKSTKCILIFKNLKPTSDDVITALYHACELDLKYYNNKIISEYISKTGTSKLDNLRGLLHTALADNAINNIQSIDYRIQEYLSKYSASMIDRKNALKDLENIKNKIEGLEVLDRTLTKMSSWIEWTCGEQDIIANITTPIFNYDEDLAKRIQDDINVKYGPNVHKMFTKCFITNEWELMTRTTVLIDIARLRTRSQARAECFPTTIKEVAHRTNKMIANPHIEIYDCFGQNGPVLTDLLAKNKWEEYLYCLRATLGNINFNDVTVMRAIFRYWWTESPTDIIWCRRISDGALLTKGDIINDETN